MWICNMKIKIINGTQEFNLYFDSKEDLQKVHAQIVEALTDSSNTKGARYTRDGDSKLFPSLFLKNSVIEIDEITEENKIFMF